MNRIKIQKDNKSGFAKTKILIAVFALIICIAYLGVINISAVKGFEIREVENKITELKKENKRLQIQVAELTSSYNIKDGVGGLNMVEAENIVYISESDQAVAIGK